MFKIPNENYEIYTQSNNKNAQLIMKFKREIQIAEGSNLFNTIIIDNLKKKVIKIEKDGLVKKYNEPYKEIQGIYHANYFRELNQMLFCDENCKLYSFNFSKMARINIKIQEKVKGIKVSEDQQLIAMRIMKKNIKIFNLKFEVIFSYKSDCFHFAIINEAPLKLVLFENLSVKVINVQQQLNNNDSNLKRLENYPILDVLSKLKSLKHYNIYVYLNDSNKKDIKQLNEYYFNLNALFPNLSVQHFSNVSASLIPLNIHSKTFNLFFIKICEFKDMNLIPYNMEKKSFYNYLLEENSNFYQQILDFIDFGFLEKFIESIPQIKVISFIGNNKTIEFLNRIFNEISNKTMILGI